MSSGQRKPASRIALSAPVHSSIRAGEDCAWSRPPAQELHRCFISSAAAEAGPNDRAGRQIVSLERVAPPSLARICARLVACDQRDRLVAMHGDEMVDEKPCTLPAVRAHGGVPGKRRGAVDQHNRASGECDGTETGRWQDSANEQTVDMPVAKIATIRLSRPRLRLSWRRPERSHGQRPQPPEPVRTRRRTGW